MISLLDKTVMSNFAVVRRPNLLGTAFGEKLATPQQAFDELQAGVEAGKLLVLDWTWLPVWTLEPAEMTRYRQLFRSLNAGEAACLTMAVERGCRVLTDDRDARKLARHLQIPLSGTLGVLARLVDTDHPMTTVCVWHRIALLAHAPALFVVPVAPWYNLCTSRP